MPRHVIEQFEMMDVHGISGSSAEILNRARPQSKAGLADGLRTPAQTTPRTGNSRLLIQPLVADGFGDGGRHEMLHRPAGLEAGADLRRGNAQRETVQQPQPERRGQRDDAFAGAGDDDEFDKLRQGFGLAPLRQGRQMIGPDQVKSSALGKRRAYSRTVSMV